MDADLTGDLDDQPPPAGAAGPGPGSPAGRGPVAGRGSLVGRGPLAGLGRERLALLALVAGLVAGAIAGAAGMRAWDADALRVAGQAEVSIGAAVAGPARPGGLIPGSTGPLFIGSVALRNTGPQPIRVGGLLAQLPGLALRSGTDPEQTVPPGGSVPLAVTVYVFSCSAGLPAAIPLIMTVRTADGRSRPAITTLSLAGTPWTSYVQLYCANLDRPGTQ